MGKSEIIDFFDLLIEERAPIPEVIRHAAAYAGSPVGVHWPRVISIASDADGELFRGSPPTGASTRRLRRTESGVVWLGPAPAGVDIEQFLLRLSVAVHAALPSLPHSEIVPPLHVVIRSAVPVRVREWALRRLGLDPGDTIRVLVGFGPRAQWEAFLGLIDQPGRVVARTKQGKYFVAISCPGQGEKFTVAQMPIGLRVGQSRAFPAIRADEAYLSGYNALRFTRPKRETVRDTVQDFSFVPSTRHQFASGEDVAAFEIFTTLNLDQIEMMPSIHALDRLTDEFGSFPLDVLESYAAHATVRRAADALYMHHSSVTYWLERAESILGFPLRDDYSRGQLLLLFNLNRYRRSLPE